MMCVARMLVGVIALTSLCSCSSERISSVKEPRVRLSNLTEHTLTDVELRLPGEDLEFGAIPPSTLTEYVSVRTVYADACVIAQITPETALLFHCWADGGVPPTVPNGDYTIELTDGLGLRVISDDR